MTIFNLPAATLVNKIIPKNSFHSYTTTRQQKKLSESIERIIWINKLADSTINLSGNLIKEIQIFKVILKEKRDIKDLLIMMERAIPYPVIYQLEYLDEISLVTSYKRIHSADEDTAVIEWMFASPWLPAKETNLTLKIADNLDKIFTNFCLQLCGMEGAKYTISELVSIQQQKNKLERQITFLNKKLKSEVQFNKKVALNLELQKYMAEYYKLKG